MNTGTPPRSASLDAPRHVGIDGDRIVAVSTTPLQGRTTVFVVKDGELQAGVAPGPPLRR